MIKNEKADSSELTIKDLDTVVGGVSASQKPAGGHGGGAGVPGSTGGGDGLGWLRNLLRDILRR